MHQGLFANTLGHGQNKQLDTIHFGDKSVNVIHYCGMGLVKLVVGLFFFIPWVAIRLVLRK